MPHIDKLTIEKGDTTFLNEEPSNCKGYHEMLLTIADGIAMPAPLDGHIVSECWSKGIILHSLPLQRTI